MKKSVLTILSLVIALVAFSQTNNSQGSITYEVVDKIEIQLDNMDPEMAAMIPKENRNTTILYFNEDASRYENFESTESLGMNDGSEGGVHIMISQPESIIFRDMKNNKIIEQTEFMTRVFLIEGDIEKAEWKITGNQKMILDFPCQEAVKGDGDDEVKVWFTPAIPVPSGPSFYSNLPGMILAMEAQGGDRSILANDVKFTPVDDKLKKPKKGKKVSRDQYDEIVAEKMKEMGSEGSAEGATTVIMSITQ